MNVQSAKQAVAKHGNAAFNGLSGAAIIWLFATFPTKEDMRREVDREHSRCVEAAAQRWRDGMDMFQTRRAIGMVETNAPIISSSPP